MGDAATPAPVVRLSGALSLTAISVEGIDRRAEARRLAVPVARLIFTVTASALGDGDSVLRLSFPRPGERALLRVVCRRGTRVTVHRLRVDDQTVTADLPAMTTGEIAVLSLLRFPTVIAAAAFGRVPLPGAGQMPPRLPLPRPDRIGGLRSAPPPGVPDGDGLEMPRFLEPPEEAAPAPVEMAPPEEAFESAPPPVPVPPAPHTETPQTPVREPAHIDAEVPASIPVEREVPLVVRLSRDRLEATPGRARDDAVIPVDPTRPVIVTVALRGIRLAEGAHRTRRLRLPDAGAAPATATFRLIGVDAGEADVSVIVRQEPVELPLATLRLRPTVTAQGSADAAPLVAATAASARPAQVAELPTLRVDEELAGGRSVLHIAAVIGQERAEGRVEIGDKAAFVDRVYARLQGIASRVEAIRDAETRRAETERLVRRYGQALADSLLGPDVRALLWRHRAEVTSLLLQTSAEIDLPWEVVHLRPPEGEDDGRTHFLADLGLLRWVYDTARPRRIAVHSAVALCPEYEDKSLRLARTAEEVAALRTHLAGDPVSPIGVPEVRSCVQNGFDLLHFAGHGRWSDAEPIGQQLLLAAFSPGAAEGVYADRDVRADLTTASRASHAPLVFLSACDVGRLRSGATGTGGFAEAFLRGGAGAFIGCGWAVRDDVASEFVRVFYDAAFGADLDLAAATRQARDAARRAGDLSGLAYAVFADPRTHLTTT